MRSLPGIGFVFLFTLVVSSWVALPIANAQTGEITGRVVAEDGAGLPNMMVFLSAVARDTRATSGASQDRTATDEDGNFKFTGLAPSRYSISVPNAKGFVRKLVPVDERQSPVYYRPGDSVTITMIKGGAITGRVTNMMGEPLIGAQVSAVMARDAEGKPLRGGGSGRGRFTDDRGVYRIYGLLPGTYIVFTRTNVSGPFPTPYDGDMPTYHPSSTRDTAAEVTVASGGEASGIDIRHRGDRGLTLSGVVSGGKEAASTPAASVVLFDTSAASSTGSSYVRPGADRGFAFSGLPDGEYVIIARSAGDDVGMASAWRRVSLRERDVTGVELKLLPLGSISGRIVIEASPDACDGKRKIPLEEFSPTAVRDDLSKDNLAFLPWRNFSSSRVNEKGEFTINDVDPGNYRIGMRLPDENYYLKATATPASVPARRGAPAAVNNVSRNGLALKQGEKVADVTVTVVEGAASLRGKVAPEKAGAQLPERLRAHLIPAEPNAADDVLRYAEAMVRAGGAFALVNLAPGKYWLMARAAPDDEPSDRPVTPTAWDANERAKLRKEAEAMKIEIELKPCQRVKDQTIKHSSMQISESRKM
jgi:hypothetical protein